MDGAMKLAEAKVELRELREQMAELGMMNDNEDEEDSEDDSFMFDGELITSGIDGKQDTTSSQEDKPVIIDTEEANKLTQREEQLIQLIALVELTVLSHFPFYVKFLSASNIFCNQRSQNPFSTSAYKYRMNVNNSAVKCCHKSVVNLVSIIGTFMSQYMLVILYGKYSRD